jgi:hypothetical protein
VAPGTIYNGAVGVGGITGTSPVNGTDSSFTGNASVAVIAKGATSVASNSQTAGPGGTGSTGDTVWNGGAGAAGTSSLGGGGGESGCSTATGHAGSGITGGTGCDGGDGGAGKQTTAGPGTIGSAPGGGGGGGFTTSSTDQDGGNGAAGRCTLTYTPTPAILMVGSSNISAGGTTATTAQLSVPNSHSFTAGEISDDTNPLPALTIASSNYSEFEWSLIAGSPAVNGDIFTFRVTKAGTALGTYSQTPQWTIGTAGSGGVRKRVIVTSE